MKARTGTAALLEMAEARKQPRELLTIELRIFGVLEVSFEILELVYFFPLVPYSPAIEGF